MPNELTLLESKRLVELESIVERGLGGFLAVGRALMDIRDSKLYLVGSPTWETYLERRWKFSRSYACRLICAARDAETLPVGNVPETEHQARVERKARKRAESLPVVDIDKPRVHTELAPLSDDEELVQAAGATPAEFLRSRVKTIRLLREEELLLGHAGWLRTLALEHDDSALQLRARAEAL